MMIRTISFLPLRADSKRPLRCCLHWHKWKDFLGVDRECVLCGRKEFWNEYGAMWIPYHDIPR